VNSAGLVRSVLYYRELSLVDSQQRAALPDRQPRFWPQIYLGISVTTLATLLLELSLTRIFSVVFYYHFAFLAISIALFGLGAGGVFSYVVAAWPGTLFEKLGGVALANSAAVLVCLTYLLSLRGPLGALQLATVYFFCAVPFLLSGIIVSLIIADTLERVDRVYFFDLMGAAGGCALLVALLNWLGGPNTVVVTAALFAVSSGVWFKLAKAGRGRIAAVSVALVLVGFIVYNSKYHAVLDVRYAKSHELKDEEFVKWNSFSRIALHPEPGSGMKSIVIDADAATGVARFDFDRLTADQLRDLRFHGPGFPYLLRPGAKTLVIGPGGGWDVARALATGSKDITGVEINPIIANTIMRQRYPQYSNNLYFRPEVHIVVEDGRSFVRRSNEHYQVLQATLVDTWASTAAGAFALSENNLYTTNAFRDYLSHLTPDGVMAFTRWGFLPPRESLRVVALAREALMQLGEADPARNVMVVRENVSQITGFGAQDTILVGRKPFSDADIATVAGSLGPGHMEAVYLPGTQNATPFRDLLLATNAEAFFDSYPFDVRPVSDDRPFFFYTTQPRDVWRYFSSASHTSEDYKINIALPLLFGLVAVSIVATIVILSLPPLVLGNRLPRQPGAVGALLYFLAIGAGYILVQVALIQKFVLFLGHPTYALTVIIFSMLVFSGLGSFFSRKFIGGVWSRLCAALVLIAVLIVALSAVVTSVTEGGVGLPFVVKVLISVLLIAAPAFVMGMPFPTALSRLETLMPACVRWAWAINAASSVLGSAAAIFLAIYLGLRTTLLIGGLLYLGAWLSAMFSPLAGKSAKEVASAR
jgi:hypothetical protein